MKPTTSWWRTGPTTIWRRIEITECDFKHGRPGATADYGVGRRWWLNLTGRPPLQSDAYLRRWPDLLEGGRQSLFRDFYVIHGLRSKPVAFGQPEKLAQAQIGVGGDGTLAGHDVADPLAGTPISLASRYLVMPIGTRNSSRSSSPGVTGLSLSMSHVLSGSRRSRHLPRPRPSTGSRRGTDRSPECSIGRSCRHEGLQAGYPAAP